jgi:hypothetical protein
MRGQETVVERLPVNEIRVYLLPLTFGELAHVKKWPLEQHSGMWKKHGIIHIVLTVMIVAL